MKKVAWLLPVLGLTLVAPAAYADPPGKAEKKAENAAKREEKREERREEKREAKEERRELRDAIRDGGASADEAKARLKELRKQAKENREDRRRALRARLKERWGGALGDERVRDELKLHARREARLAAMEQAARASGKLEMLPRIAKLGEREDARHLRRMNHLTGKADGGTK